MAREPTSRARLAIEVFAPSDLVWQLLTEFRHWPAWGPSVREVDSSSVRVAPGVRGRVRTPVGIWLPFVITAVEPGRSWNWRVGGIDATGHVVTPLGDSQCRVEFTVSRWLLPYLLVLRVGLRRLKELAEAA